MKPVILYVDDSTTNLTLFEALFPEEWIIVTVPDPLSALEKLKEVVPWVIISDQKMPGMTGVRFLELARQIRPDAVRIIITGYSEEELVIESVRKAQIFDYLKKPWDADELEASLRRAVQFYSMNEEAKKLKQDLVDRESRLEKQNLELQQKALSLELSNRRETEIRKELEAWAPPFLLWMMKENIQFPIKKDLVGITFDIINSSQIHEVMLNGRSLRAAIIRKFSEVVLGHGGWRESHSGDSSYGHFGLIDVANPADRALSAAREFRVSLRSISGVYGAPIECGISLHVMKDSIVNVHSVHVSAPSGEITQKSFDTASSDVDLLHRMEKVVHTLPGTNIIMSGSFLERLEKKPDALVPIGYTKFKGQAKPTEIFIVPSDLVKIEDLEKLKNSITGAEEQAA